jgi:CheY-like chemotaxis protein
MPEAKPKILVVEDNADEAQMVKMILEPEGYEVALAADGREGLQKAEADKPDLVVLDVMMPVLDGFAMCAKLREDPDFQSVPVILLTAVAAHIRDTSYPISGVLRAQAEEYLEKPVNPEELIATVARCLQR